MLDVSLGSMLVTYASYSLLTLLALILGAWSVLNAVEKRAKNKSKERKVNYARTPMQMLSIASRKRFDLIEKQMNEKHGNIYGCSHLGSYTIVTTDPELIQIVLNKEFTKFPNRRPFELGDPIFQTMLFSTRDERWKRLRSIMTPTFSTGKLRKIKYCIDNTSSTLLKNVDNAIDCGKTDSVNVKRYVGAFTMDTIIQMAYGVQIDSLADQDNPIITNAKRFFSTDQSFKNLFSFFLAFSAPKLATKLGIRVNGDVLDFFESIAMDIIDKKRNEIESRGSIGRATNFIELLLEAEQEAQRLSHVDEGLKKSSNKYLSNLEIVSQCVLFFMVGYDTTATAIANTLHLLAMHPECEEKVYREVIEVIDQLAQESGETDPFKLVTLDNLARFEYLNAAINEALRLYPPGPAFERYASEDVHLESDDGKIKLDVKKGDIIRVPVYALHHDPNNFPDPENYNPERFLGTPTFHKYAYIPFGSGPRSCIAKSLALLETRMAVLHLIRKFRFSPSKETKAKPDFFVSADILISRDIFLKVERR